MPDWLATAPIIARETQGFMTCRQGWMPFAGGFGLLLPEAGPDGLFPTPEAAQRAGEACQRRHHSAGQLNGTHAPQCARRVRAMEGPNHQEPQP